MGLTLWAVGKTGSAPNKNFNFFFFLVRISGIIIEQNLANFVAIDSLFEFKLLR